MYVPVLIKPLDDTGRTYEGLFLVDTGATDSMAPASALVEAGIQPIGRRRYQLADGSFVEFPFGLARIEFTQLESAGVAIDPVRQTLNRLPAISLR